MLVMIGFLTGEEGDVAVDKKLFLDRVWRRRMGRGGEVVGAEIFYVCLRSRCRILGGVKRGW